MSALLDQFMSEARDALQGIAEKLMDLENAPDDAALVNELFRLVHTLKGNSGLFDFPEMTRVLHAAEDLMVVVRSGKLAYSRTLADQLMDAMDFVGELCDAIETGGSVNVARANDAVHLTAALRLLMPPDDATHTSVPATTATAPGVDATTAATSVGTDAGCVLGAIPETARMAAFRHAQNGTPVLLVTYSPVEDCFFQGADPLHTVLQGPARIWGRISARENWPLLEELNAYRCVLDFQTLVATSREVVAEHYRYEIDRVTLEEVAAMDLLWPEGHPNGGPADEDFVADAHLQLRTHNIAGLRLGTETMLELSVVGTWTASVLRWMLVVADYLPAHENTMALLIESLATQVRPRWPKPDTSDTSGPPAQPCLRPLTSAEATARASIFAAQRVILTLTDRPAWYLGRLLAVARVLANCSTAVGDGTAQREIDVALAQTFDLESSAPLLAWIDSRTPPPSPDVGVPPSPPVVEPAEPPPEPVDTALSVADAKQGALSGTDALKFGRRAEDAVGVAKSLKVDQSKIDRLMNLIGEMVVSKNALPYLSQRAETQYGVRDLAREIKAQYAVINRIAEELQDAIMQVRMLPVSFVFQRFPRMVREISRKLGKEIHLELIGEDTEIDKNIIESLADPLVHVIRNSVDHGIELPAARVAAGKPAAGTIVLKAVQDADRVIIEITDDGKGIDPQVMKRKAYEKGLIDENTMERMSDREAVDLIFAPGLSTAEAVSDLSGRGVGMDVVRSAVEKCNGSIELTSDVGRGTNIQIALPLSMAVTQVMVVESDGQLFGVPIDHVVETVRIPRNTIRYIKHAGTTTLRGRVIALKALNALLGLSAVPVANHDDEITVLIARVGTEIVGLIVDDFRETLAVIQKPLEGVMGRIAAYSGSAIIGDGSVLMILNVKGVL